VSSAPIRPLVALVACAVAVAIGGCSGPEPTRVDLDLVASERAERLVGLWFDSTQIAQRDVRELWPESPPMTFVFTEWVDPGEYRDRILQCLEGRLGRAVDEIGGPAVEGEPPWAPAVAEGECRHEFPPFTSEISLGGPIEARWLDTQLTTVLPACVRSFGGRLEIADTRSVIDAIRDRPLSGDGPRDIWSIVAVSGVSLLDRAAMRASCPDPGLALDALPLPVIDR
jgi:hypothetical protein